jgi:hypothetical protein
MGRLTPGPKPTLFQGLQKLPIIRISSLMELRIIGSVTTMQTVVETPAYLDAADEAGLSEEEREAIKNMLARDPTAGDPIVGTGGCRKVRVAGRGKGKSGGYRVITFFTGPDLPLFLITVFGKGERSDLTQKERNALAGLTKLIVEGYRGKVSKLPRQR